MEWKAVEEVKELEAVNVFHERYPDEPGPLPEGWASRDFGHRNGILSWCKGNWMDARDWGSARQFFFFYFI